MNPPFEPRKLRESLSIRLDATLLAWAKTQSQTMNLSLTQFVEGCIRVRFRQQRKLDRIKKRAIDAAA